MSILWAIFIGFTVGVLAKFLTPGRDPGGLIVTILLGIAGAVTATFLGRQMGWYAEGQNAGFLASILGSILLLMLYRVIRRPRPII